MDRDTFTPTNCPRFVLSLNYGRVNVNEVWQHIFPVVLYNWIGSYDVLLRVKL